jgi:hypothetical protein
VTVLADFVQAAGLDRMFGKQNGLWSSASVTGVRATDFDDGRCFFFLMQYPLSNESSIGEPPMIMSCPPHLINVSNAQKPVSVDPHNQQKQFLLGVYRAHYAKKKRPFRTFFCVYFVN